MTTLVEKILTGLVPDTGGAGELFELHPVPSLLLSRVGRITAANDAALRLFRCSAPALVGGAMVGFFPELGRGLAGIRTLDAHARVAVRRPDASNFIARVHLAPLAEDAEATLLVTLEDLTEFEDAIAANNKELESFMSVAGHDLRGPLRILKGFADALEDECGSVINEEGRGFLKEILKASDRMEGLIDGMLTLSRASRAEMSCEQLDLSTLVDLVTYELRHGKDERNVAFEGEAGISVWGDVRLMMTVLRTLLGNAWKYTSHTEKPTVRCYTEERDGAALGLRLRQRSRVRHGACRSPVQAVHAAASTGRVHGVWPGARDRLSHRETPWRGHRSPGRGRAGHDDPLLAQGLAALRQCRRRARCDLLDIAHIRRWKWWLQAQSPRACHLPEWPA